MDGKRQISGKLVPEIMFVQAVRANLFSLKADILKVVLASFSGENRRNRTLIISAHVSCTFGTAQ